MENDNSTESDFWNALKQHKKQKFDEDRQRFLKEAIQKDDAGWTHHTEYHWSRLLNGKRLDYWPSRKKWRYGEKIMRGDVYNFIRKTQGPSNTPQPPLSIRESRNHALENTTNMTNSLRNDA